LPREAGLTWLLAPDKALTAIADFTQSTPAPPHNLLRDWSSSNELQSHDGHRAKRKALLPPGLVVVGDLIGSGAAQEQAVVGETPNIAARLQAIAEPNTVVIAESTRRLLGNLFDLQDLGAKDLKGLDAPVRASGVLRPASVESRFEALHASGLTELVG
jgi:class 3 adenylate cyclase